MTKYKGGLYRCPVCNRQMLGDYAENSFQCFGQPDAQHTPAFVVRTHDTVGLNSFAPVKVWSK